MDNGKRLLLINLKMCKPSDSIIVNYFWVKCTAQEIDYTFSTLNWYIQLLPQLYIIIHDELFDKQK